MSLFSVYLDNDTKLSSAAIQELRDERQNAIEVAGAMALAIESLQKICEHRDIMDVDTSTHNTSGVEICRRCGKQLSSW